MKRVIYAFVIVVIISCRGELKGEKNPEVNENKTKTEVKEVDTSTMVHFEGGIITIGSDTGLANEKPAFEKEIAPFYLDKNLVTVAEFGIFIEKTGYITEAEKFGDSGIFSFQTGAWSLVKGTNWMYPEGPTGERAKENHPVTHVSWNDARYYAHWMGKRLPTEYEWEFAAKSGKNTFDTYSWGNEVKIDGKYMANVWQGNSATKLEVMDGYILTSPVGIYGETSVGLTDMGGNVWQWCENIYESYPGSSIKEQSDSKVRSTRGGSLCSTKL